MKSKVLIVDRVYKRSRDQFDRAEEIEFVSVAKEEAAIAEAIAAEKAAAVVLATDKYVGPLYDALPEKGLIARYGVGHDSIDKQQATAKRQFVTITPGVLDNSVAEHVLFLMGCLARQLATQDAQVKGGVWNKTTGFELAGKTLLVLGCGAIGRSVAAKAGLGLGMTVIGYDVQPLDAAVMKQKYGIVELARSLESALGRADIVSVHLPAIEATKDFVNAALLAQMKPGSCIINTSRGSVLDENALYDALSSGQLGGAGLDVFKNEPYEPQDPGKDLRKLDSVVMTPHLGSSTAEASARMAECVIRNIRCWAQQDWTGMDIVNKEVLQ